MPNPVSFVAQFVIGLVNAISGAKQLSTIAAAINNSVHWLAQITGDVAATITWAGLRTGAAWNHVLHPAFTDGSARLEYASRAHNYALNWIVDVIIPNSVKAGTHKVWEGGVYPLRKQMTGVLKAIGWPYHGSTNIDARLRILEARKTPGLPGWWQIPKGTGFRMTETVQVWVKAPAILSAKLAPSMTGDVVKQLGYGNQSRNLDRLTALIVGALQHVTSAVDSGIVALLQSGSY